MSGDAPLHGRSAGPTSNPAIRVRRRSFLKSTAMVGGWTALGAAGTAGPFKAEDWGDYIPADKRLDPVWVRSLFERGAPAVYTKSRDELKHIGMPVGGICCGTLYLGGDGRLWNWDIFNQKTEGVLPRRVSWKDVGMDFQTGDSEIRPRDGATYVRPAVPEDSPSIAQGFAIRVRRRNGGWEPIRTLDAKGWAEVSFSGRYPIGEVEYSDPASEVGVRLEAFSPFVPLSFEDSSLPATLFCFRVSNRGRERLRLELSGWLQNAVLFHSGREGEGRRRNRVSRVPGATMIRMGFEPAGRRVGGRPDLPLEDFEGGYGGWVTEGTAFGKEPASRTSIPSYQGEVGGDGERVVNSHATAPGTTVGEKDDQIGRLISPAFRIRRRFLQFWVGGGQRDEVGVHLRVDGRIVRTSRGRNGNRMRREFWEVGEYEGREGVIEIMDGARGGWGHVGADAFVQTDVPVAGEPLGHRPDEGTMALALLEEDGAGVKSDPEAIQGEGGAFFPGGRRRGERREAAPVGAVSRWMELGPGETREVRFVVAWHFPNTTLPVPDARSGNHVARRFADAGAVVGHLSREYRRLELLTRRWCGTWAASTLPCWFLDRVFATVSTLATTTSHRFATGRFWGWEGVGCCEGTCTHVWHYAQAVARIFPELERDLRERVDFGAGFDDATGVIRHRGEGTGPAVDGHCGRILGVLREHQMSRDDGFLRRLWPRVKRAAEYVMAHDRDGDGILDGAQENTLDAAWYGQIAWITSLSVAALRAVEVMALELGDEVFAGRCRAQHEKARRSLETRLFNGAYFIQVADPSREKSLGTYEACHIDQVHGQSWAWQVNLGRVLDREKVLSALKSLWRYNFAPDVGPFRRKFTAGRPYALAGEAGLVMTSNPRLIPNVYGTPSWQIGYFNECMSGFEHQVASHMVAEGMVKEGMAVTRAIHDRYHPARRNPYNEIECSDHYARAMAAYGTFITACGFECHGPSGHLGFAPKLTPEDFAAAFTSAEGWGLYRQRREAREQRHWIEIRYGRLNLRSLAVEVPEAVSVRRAALVHQGVRRPVAMDQDGARLTVRFPEAVQLESGDAAGAGGIELRLEWA